MRHAKDAEMRLKTLRAPLYRAFHRVFRTPKPTFVCPACGYRGPFMDKRSRSDAKCPACGALERTRLQFAVLERCLSGFEPETKSVLHIAPEPILKRHLRRRFLDYCSADLARPDVDLTLDIQRLPFRDASFDCVFASHVLEYPADDLAAISEVRRVLRDGAMAFLPVPMLAKHTVDLATRNPVSRMMHEPGLDYFERYRAHFKRVELVRSDEVDARFQPFVCGNDGHASMPLQAGPGIYVDVVPVCYA